LLSNRTMAVSRIYLFFFLAVLLAACGNNEQEVTLVEESYGDSLWTDSVFGSLSEQERINQHLLYEIPPAFQNNIDSLAVRITAEQPGALSFSAWDVDSIFRLRSILDTCKIIQPLFLAGYFSYLQIPRYPYWESQEELRSPEYLKVFSNAGYGIIDLQENFAHTPNWKLWMDTASKMNLTVVDGHYSDRKIAKDFSRFFLQLSGNLNMMRLDLNTYDTTKLEALRKSSGFEGMFIVDCSEQRTLLQIEGGADFVQVAMTGENEFVRSGGSGKDWKNEAFAESTRRILRLKSAFVADEIEPYHPSVAVRFSSLRLTSGAVSLIRQNGKILPATKGFSMYCETKISLPQKVRQENKIILHERTITTKDIDHIAKSDGVKVVCVDDSTDKVVIEKLADLKASSKTVICFSSPKLFTQFTESPNLLFAPISQPTDFAVLCQQISGRLPIRGDFWIGDTLHTGIKIKKGKLARTSPEYTGLDKDTLERIEWGVNSAMAGRAYPGCQVLIAKDGCIIYDRSFGHHTYEREKLVTENSMYDLASVTKVVATTMIGMKLWEMNAFELDDSLSEYLPDSLKYHLKFPSTIRNITFQELFVHKAGLPAGFPIIGYMQYMNDKIERWDKYYCDFQDTCWSVEVGEGFYMEKAYQDSMWLRLNQIWLDPKKPYKYSDVSMNTLYFMFKSIIEKNKKLFGFNKNEKEYKDVNLFSEYLYNTFYKPLGMEHTRYLPRRHYDKSEVVPTENDRWWRQQLLQGHVHDPNAALHGGIAGNAGMFSTTNDLAILGQMLLNGGYYDGTRYLAQETVDKFASRQPESHRGLGWNKPTQSGNLYACADSSSLGTYGHTGFTGTCMWMDPKTNLVYIFLCNRVHPSVNERIYQYNIRARVHQAAYDAMINGSGVRG